MGLNFRGSIFSVRGSNAGADLQIVKEFIEAISEGHLQTKTMAEDALESHLIYFNHLL